MFYRSVIPYYNTSPSSHIESRNDRIQGTRGWPQEKVSISFIPTGESRRKISQDIQEGRDAIRLGATSVKRHFTPGIQKSKSRGRTRSRLETGLREPTHQDTYSSKRIVNSELDRLDVAIERNRDESSIAITNRDDRFSFVLRWISRKGESAWSFHGLFRIVLQEQSGNTVTGRRARARGERQTGPTPYILVSFY